MKCLRILRGLFTRPVSVEGIVSNALVTSVDKRVNVRQKQSHYPRQLPPALIFISLMFCCFGVRAQNCTIENAAHVIPVSLSVPYIPPSDYWGYPGGGPFYYSDYYDFWSRGTADGLTAYAPPFGVTHNNFPQPAIYFHIAPGSASYREILGQPSPQPQGYARVANKDGAYYDIICNSYFATMSIPTESDKGPDCPACDNGPDPINPSNGNEFLSEVDARLHSGLEFKREYSSLEVGAGDMGTGWRHTASKKLSVQSGSNVLRTQSYSTAVSACTSGWDELKAAIPSRNAWVASYSNSVCILYNNGVAVSILPIFGGLFNSDRVVGVQAIRGDGKELAFFAGNNAATSPYTGNLGISERLEVVPGGYRLTDINDVVELYGSNGKLLSTIDRAGNTQTFSYLAPNGKLSEVIDNFGHKFIFGYNAQGLLASVTEPNNAVTSYAYTAGRLTSVTHPDNTIRQYFYNDPDWPAGISSLVDENNQTVFVLDYDAQGRVLSSQLAGVAATMSFAYNSNGTTTQTDTLGAVRTFGFQQIGGHLRNTGVTGSPCPECGYSKGISYDSNGFVASVTDYNDHVTTYTHDTKGQETSRTEASGTPQARTITTAWHGSYRLPLTVNEYAGGSTGSPLVRSTSYTYDASGNLQTRKITDSPSGKTRIWTYSNYTAYGQPQAVDGPRTDVSDITTLSYYNCSTGAQCGQLYTMSNALGQVTTFNSYDANGRPLTITDPNGLVTTLTYTPRGWLASKNVGGETTTYQYWPNGLLKWVTYPNGGFLSYTYDAAHRLTDVYDALANHVHYTLDPMGNPTQIDIYDASNTLVQTEQRVYSNLNRLYQTIGAGSGEITTYAYDPNGNLSTVADPLNRQTLNSYDALDRLINVTDAANGLTQYGYDSLDQLTSVTDPRNLTTNYTVDGLGNVNTLNSPDTGGAASSYDAAGNVTARTDAKNQTTAYQYDALNRRTRITQHDGGLIQFTYDQGTYGKGHLTGMSDTSGSTSWVYEVHGRPVQQTVTFTGRTGALTTSWGYDSAGRLQTTTQPSGKVIGTQWNGGRVSDLTLNGSPLVSNIVYHPFGPPKSWTLGNGQTDTRRYDLNGRITADPVDSTLAYDAASRLITRTQGNRSILSGSTSYGYDNLDRVTSYSINGGTSNLFSYDANTNRTSQRIGGVTTTYGMDSASNRLLSITSGSNSTVLGYDANGSRTQAIQTNTRTYTYNAQGQLSGTSVPTNALSFAYNGFGQQAKWMHYTNTLYYLFDEGGEMTGEYGINSLALRSEYIRLEGMPVAILTPTATYYVHSDYLNTPRQIDDASGTARWAWHPVPYGSNAPNTNPTGTNTAFSSGLRYPGQYFFSDAGFSRNGFRTYDSSTGRYLESDPIGLAGGLNTYAYVGGNPVSFSDPMGLETPTVTLGKFPFARDPTVGPFGLVCGTGWNATWVPDGPWKQACERHDKCYEKCGVNRFECDTQFLLDSGNIYYFLAIRYAGGQDAYNRAQKKCNGCESGGIP